MTIHATSKSNSLITEALEIVRSFTALTHRLSVLPAIEPAARPHHPKKARPMKIIIVNPHHYAPCYGIALHRIFDSVEALQKLTLPFDAQRWYIFTDAGIYLYLDHAAARRA